MLNMEYEIQLGKYKVINLVSCEVRKSANKLSDTATIVLPGMAYSEALNVEQKINRGDIANIKLGYSGKLFQEFSGYIASIGTDNQIIIECEDGMFQLRKEVENKQYNDIDISEVIEDVVGQIGGFTVVKGDGISDVRYDKFTVSNATAYDVLDKLKEDTDAHIFVKGTEVHVHLKFTYKEGDVKYDFSRNVENSSLTYVKEDDKKVLVEVVGINRKNEKTKVEVGETGGDKITVHRYNMSDSEALKRVGEEEMKKHRYTGYEGEIVGWLFPYCTYGYSAEVLDTEYAERQGIYYVEAVTTLFDESGGRRKINLGIKVA